jgi:hypothetical protein
MSKLFPEPEAWRQFPPAMPPALVQLGMEDEQIHNSYGWGQIYYLFEDAEYILQRLIDFQTPLVCDYINPMIYTIENRWEYDSDITLFEWSLKSDNHEAMSDFELSQFSFREGLKALADIKARFDISPEKCRIALGFREPEEHRRFSDRLRAKSFEYNQYISDRDKSKISMVRIVIEIVFGLGILCVLLPELRGIGLVAVIFSILGAIGVRKHTRNDQSQ